MNSQADSQADKPRSKTRRWTIAGLAAGTIAVGTAAAVGAAAAWHGHAHAFGPRGGHMGGPGMFGMHGSMDPETMNKRIDAMVGWMLADIDATPDQRARVGTIVKGAANDLMPLRQRHMEARKQSAQLLAAPTIDKAQLERLRIEQMQLGDTVSRRMLQAMTDAAEVLNPDQRAKLIAKWQERRGRWQG